DMKLSESLELAQRELEVRHDVYTQDVLAWSLYKSGKLEQAAAAMDRALRPGTRDALLYYHAALIHRALGNATAARNYLEGALAINPEFHISYADDARRILAATSDRPATTSNRAAASSGHAAPDRAATAGNPNLPAGDK